MFYVFSQDAFARKELYDIKAPSVFTKRLAGRTIVNKSQGTSECSSLPLLLY